MSTARTMTVVRAGLLTTVQDRGRWGYQSIGVPVAGPMDLSSHDTANALLGNDASAATLEVTIVGPVLRFDTQARVVVTGGHFDVTVDGALLALNHEKVIAPGAMVAFGQRRLGARAYVGVDGGFDTPVMLGSRSTHADTGFGRQVVAGDVLPLGGAHQRPAITSRGSLIPAGGARVRVRRGPQAEGVPDAAFDTLTQTRFIIGSQSSRMAYRLSGAPVALPERPPMLSDAAFMGGIQVTPSGEAILLMADRQTTGGYPQIATVVSADLPQAGQLAPGDWIEFEVVG